MKRCLTDWDNPAAWTKLRRTRVQPRASVSQLWDRDPFGILPVQTLVACQPGVWLDRGVPVGPFNQELYDIPGGTSFPDGELVLWAEGTQQVKALDLTRPVVVNSWVETLLRHFPWADGVHADYFGRQDWIRRVPDYDWIAYEAGLRTFARLLEQERPGFCLIGQQWHLTPVTDVLDGLYLEESPGHFGLSFGQIAVNMARHGRGPEWVVELREPAKFVLEYVRQVEAFCSDPKAYLPLEHGLTESQVASLGPCYLAAGRDGDAW